MGRVPAALALSLSGLAASLAATAGAFVVCCANAGAARQSEEMHAARLKSEMRHFLFDIFFDLQFETSIAKRSLVARQLHRKRNYIIRALGCELKANSLLDS